MWIGKKMQPIFEKENGSCDSQKSKMMAYIDNLISFTMMDLQMPHPYLLGYEKIPQGLLMIRKEM